MWILASIKRCKIEEKESLSDEAMQLMKIFGSIVKKCL